MPIPGLGMEECFAVVPGRGGCDHALVAEVVQAFVLARKSGLSDHTRFAGRKHMLYYAVVFFVIALLAAVFGFGGIAAGAAGIAKILFIVFLVLFVVSLIFGMRGRGRGAL